jgi:hypothetical protein
VASAMSIKCANCWRSIAIDTPSCPHCGFRFGEGKIGRELENRRRHSPTRPSTFFRRALVIPLVSCFLIALVFRSDLFLALGIGILVAALPIYALVAAVMYALLGRCQRPRQMLAIWLVAPLPHAVLQVFAAWLLLPSLSIHGSTLISLALISLLVGYINVGIVALLYHLLRRTGSIDPLGDEPCNPLPNTDAREQVARAG